VKINPRVIYLSIVFTFLVAMVVNVAAADTLEAAKLTKVASNVASDSNPVWSPNGKEILFAKGEGSYGYGANLYKVFSDGSGEKKLASDTYSGYTWSPDGSKISYYQFTDEVGSYDLSLMNADGTKKTQLLNPVSNLFFYIYTWFPSGSKVAYVSGVDNIGSLYEINSDGSNNHETDVYVNGAIAVSPDASKILCTNWDWEYPTEIYVQSLNQNGDSSYLTNGSIFPQTQSWQSEVWSPDGKKIVYYSDENGKSDIYTIKIDGTGKTQLTSDSANDYSPIFSPDGKKIVYVSEKSGNEDIWVMDADGKNKVQLTTDSARDSYPEWSPDGKKIAFYSERGGDRGIYTLTLENGNKPVAAFSASPTSGNAPLKVQFTDKSSNVPTSWKWSFGDGKTSTVKNPAYTYNKAGKYTVSLTVKNAAGTSTKTIKNYITVNAAPVKPVASFSASPTSGNAPLKVTFTDKSTNSPTSWKWTFGDGKTSTLKSPAYTYSKAGKYTVSLTVKNAAGTSTKTIKNCITVNAAPVKPVASFSASPTSGKAPLKVQFTDKSTGLPTSWKWSFGDGTYSTAKSPVHTYSKVGKYTVSLTVKNAKGSSTKTISGYITVSKK
jgi:PKD repeat protein